MAQSKIEDVAALLQHFSATGSLDQRLAALVELIKQRALHALRDDERLSAGTMSLGKLAADPRATEDRLRAIAALSRIGTVKSLSNRVGELLGAALEKPLPEFASLKDPDDRYYVASALHRGKEDWVPEYAATALVDEKQAEKARQELVGVLFNRADNLSQVFRWIGAALISFRPETKNPGDSIAKRLERIVTAVRPHAITTLIEPGHEIGKSLQDMLRSAFKGSRPPETSDVAQRTMEEIAGLLHDIARTQISLVTDSSVYTALDVPKSWFSPPEWRFLAEKSPNLQLLTRDIREALTLLAKQGATDRELFEQLAKASGSTEKAVKITARIAAQHPELDADVSAWLRSGGRISSKRTLVALEESRELSADPILASLMNDAVKLRTALSGISEDTLTELRLLEPGLSGPLETLIGRCRAVLNGVDTMAEKRGLQLRGQTGQVVDYSPVLHELIGGHVQGVRKVRIRQPMIMRVGADGADTIVWKALVEKM